MIFDRSVRLLLSLVFCLAAWLKVDYYFVDGDWNALVPAMRNEIVLAGIVGLEIFAALGLWFSRMRLARSPRVELDRSRVGRALPV